MKSIDQHSFLFSGTTSGSGLSRFSRFFGFIRMFSDNSQ
ncbi:ISxcd1 transposase [Yersinia ruckeri ATCC 29473]|nr:ISxcd1 transposase [Yersinia ruckeri ATCC 29473]